MGLAALSTALVLLLAPEDEVLPRARESGGAGGSIDGVAGGPAGEPAAGGTLLLPRRYRFGFETTDRAGRELYSMRQVPIFLGGRATQPDWMQEFGAQAEPGSRDRFPREPMAAFSADAPHSGARALRLESRGDHALVHLARPIPAMGGIGVRLDAQARLRGLDHGSLRLRVRFLGNAGASGPRRIESAPLSGTSGWTKVELRGQAPEGTDSLDIEILLLGSYRDLGAEAWVDSLTLDLVPGLETDWGGRGLLLFGARDPEVPFRLEVRGLSPGAYGVEAVLEGMPLVGREAPPPAMHCARRYVPTLASGAGAPLRLRGDLRAMFGSERLAPGLHRLQLRVRGPARSPEDAGPVLAEGVERIGILSAAAGPSPARGMRIGWALRDDEVRAGSADLLEELPSGFPVHELLWDLAGVSASGRALELPPAVKLAGERPHLPWRGRLGPEWLRSAEAGSRIKDWTPVIRAWSVAAERADPGALPGLRRIQEETPSLLLGAGTSGPRPAWASFREVEIDPAAVEKAPAADPEGWALVTPPPPVGGREELRAVSALLLDLALAGHRRVFFRGLDGLLSERHPAGKRSPRAAALALWTLGRLLAAGPVRARPSWDARGRFLIVEDGAEHVLIAMARGAEPFALQVFTGAPLLGEDLLGDPIEVPCDSATLLTRIAVPLEPAVYRGIDLGLVESVESLREDGSGLEPVSVWQELRFRMAIRTPQAAAVRASLRLPEGWRAAETTVARSPAGGEEATFVFRVLPPEGIASGRVPAALRFEIDAPGRPTRFTVERDLEVASRWVRIAAARVDPRGREIAFLIESLAARPVEARIDCRVFLGQGRDLIESWRERLPLGGRREFFLPLPAPPELLGGKEVRIGVEIRGRHGAVGERYVLERDGSGFTLARR